MNLKLPKDQEFSILHRLITRLSEGGILSVVVSDGIYCTYHSPSGVEVKYVLFKRDEKTVLSVEVQGDTVEILCSIDNNQAFDIVARWMERIRQKPMVDDALARFLSYSA